MATVRLRPNAIARPALSSQVRPAMVLQERDARALLESAERLDVSRGGFFAAGPAGIQVWSGPFDGPGGSHGSAVHLGSVDWSYDTPSVTTPRSTAQWSPPAASPPARRPLRSSAG
jgi:hypothetical protein